MQERSRKPRRRADPLVRLDRGREPRPRAAVVACCRMETSDREVDETERPRSGAHVRPSPRHRLESLEQLGGGSGITELGGDVGCGDVDEHGHVVERTLRCLTAAIGDPRDRLVAATQIEQEDRAVELQREREADRGIAVRRLQVGLGDVAEVVADGEALREREDLGFRGTGAAEQLVDLARPVDGLAVPTPYDFDEHAEEAELAAQGESDREVEQRDAARESLGDGGDVAEREVGEGDLQLGEQRDVSAEVVLVGERTQIDGDAPALRDRVGLLQREGAGVECLRDQRRFTEAAGHGDRLEARPVATRGIDAVHELGAECTEREHALG